MIDRILSTFHIHAHFIPIIVGVGGDWLRLELLPQVQQGGVRQPIHRSGRQGPFPEGGSTRGYGLRLCDLDSLTRRFRQAAGSPPRNAAEVPQCLHLDAGRS